MKKIFSITFVLLFMFSMIPTQVEAKVDIQDSTLSHTGTYHNYGNIHVCNGRPFDCVVISQK